MVRRILKWALSLTLLAFILVFFVLPMVASTEEGRKKLSELMSSALNREVTIGGLDVGFFYSSLEIEKLRVANPDGYPEGTYLLEADSLDMDASLSSLLEGLLKGRMGGSGLRIHIMRKGDGSNLDGLIPKRDKRAEKKEGAPEIPALDFVCALSDCELILEDLDKNEKVRVTDVDVDTRVQNSADGPAATFRMRVASLDNKTLRITDMQMDARAAGDDVEITNLRATLPGDGRLSGDGKLRVRGGNEWTLNLNAKGVGIDEDMMPFVATVYPPLASVSGQVTGDFDSDFELHGQGLTWEAIKPTLSGKGKMALSGLGLPADSLLLQIARLAGSKADSVELNTAGAVFDVKNGWLEFARLSASGEEARYDLSGRVSLDGKLDLAMDLMPLVKLFGGGDAYAEASKYVDKLPLRIVGTTDKPRLKAPDAKSLARGAIDKQLGGLLDKIGK